MYYYKLQKISTNISLSCVTHSKLSFNTFSAQTFPSEIKDISFFLLFFIIPQKMMAVTFLCLPSLYYFTATIIPLPLLSFRLVIIAKELGSFPLKIITGLRSSEGSFFKISMLKSCP